MSQLPNSPSQCVLYFNRGTSCYIRLLVSVFSLRKHYSGPIKLIQEGDIERPVTDLLEKMGVSIQLLPLSADPVLVARASLWRVMEEDYALMLDADTIVCGPVDEFFGWIREHGFVASWFTGWLTTGRSMRKRIEEWGKVVPQMVSTAIGYGKAINGGVQGWSKATSVMAAYEALTRQGHAAGCNRIVLDEIALQLLLPHHQHHLADHVWNTSGSFGDVSKARIVHYHGKKHCLENPRCDLWKRHYFELRSSFPDHAGTLGKPWGDRRLARFLERVSPRRKDLTIVTAVNPAYAGRLKRNIQAWMELPGLENQRFIVFVNGFKRPSDRRFLDLPNVKVIRWHYPHQTASQRETMLAAFLLGVARHVKTEYWMKLDADCRPQRRWWEWPEYEKQTITSHRWGYTRMKGDAGAAEHWFNRLDKAFSPSAPYFKVQFDPVNNRVSHQPSILGRLRCLALLKRSAPLCQSHRRQHPHQHRSLD